MKIHFDSLYLCPDLLNRSPDLLNRSPDLVKREADTVQCLFMALNMQFLHMVF